VLNTRTSKITWSPTLTPLPEVSERVKISIRKMRLDKFEIAMHERTTHYTSSSPTRRGWWISSDKLVPAARSVRWQLAGLVRFGRTVTAYPGPCMVSVNKIL
jgi:hypothetical protein